LANIELNIVALGDFSAVNAEIKKLQAQVAALNNGLGINPITPQLSSSLKTTTNDFSNALLASNGFTKQTVQLTSETQKFGKALESGKLSLGQYFQIINSRSGAATDSVKQLALEQTKLQNSVIMADPTKQGFYSVFTPTTIDATANATKIAANEANIYALAVQKGSQKLIDFGKNTQWAGRQLTVGLGIPILLFGSQAVKSFDDVNKALTQLQKVYGEGLTPPSQDQVNKISQDVLNLGRNLAQTTGISQQFTVQVAAQFAAMGKMGDNLTNATEQTVRLAKLGNLDQQTATNAVIALQNVYKLNTTQLGDAVNYFGAIQKQTSLSMNDLVSAESKVGPIIDQLGGSYKDTSIMLLAMKEAGVPAAQAANALKSAFGSIIAPTSAAVKEFKSFGINLEAIKTAGGPVQMIQQLQASLQNLSPLVKEQLIEKLFGKYQFSRMSALIDNFGKVGSQTVNAIKVAGASSSQLADLANQEMKQATSSPSAQWQIALNTFKADLYPVGQMIIKIGTDVMKFANGVAKAFQGLPGPVKLVLGILVGFVAISGPVIMLTGLLANFAGNILKGVFNLKQLVTGGKTLGQLLTPELIAAQNASDLFSQGVLGDADAIKVLNEQIVILTNNLNNLVNNMGQGAGLPAITDSLKTDVGALVTKEATIAEQLVLPGFATGGFVPGSGNSDSFPAMLTPGEAVIPKGPAKQYSSFIGAMIGGNLKGYAEGTIRAYPEYALRLQNRSENMARRAGTTSEESVMAPLAMRIGESRNITPSASQVQKGSFDPIVSQYKDIVKNFTQKLNEHFNTTYSNIVDSDERFSKAWTEAGKSVESEVNKIQSDVEKGIVRKTFGLDEDVYGTIPTMSRRPGGNVPERARKAIQSVRATGRRSYVSISGGAKALYEKMTDSSASEMQMGHVYGPQQIAVDELKQLPNQTKALSKAMEVMGQNVTEGYSTGIKNSSTKVEKSAEELAKIPLETVQKELDINSPSGSFADNVGKPIVQGIQQGFQEALPGFENIVTSSMNETAGKLSSGVNGEPWWMAGENYVTQTAKGITENSAVVVDAANEVADKASVSMVERVKGTLSGKVGKTGGMGLAMALPMLSGMLPQSIGGVNISGATSIASSGLSGGLAASMIGMNAEEGTFAAKIGSLAPAIGGAVAAFSLLKMAIDNTTAANREAKNVMQETYGKSNVATQYFGLSASNISQFDFSGLISGVKSSTTSLQENKAAIDALTAAYQNATDQQTKDYLKQVGAASGSALTDLMKARYNTDLAQGATAKQALQDITSIMKASGQGTLARQYALNNIGAKSTDNAAKGFQDALRTALAPYEEYATKAKKEKFALQGRGAPTDAERAQNVKAEDIAAVATELLNVAQTTPKNLKTIIDGLTGASGKAAKDLVNTEGVFKSLQDTVSKVNPDMATWMQKQRDLYDAGKKNALTTVDMAKAVSLLNSNLIQSPSDLQKMADAAKRTIAEEIDFLFNSAKAQSTKPGGGSSTTTPPPLPPIVDTSIPKPFTGTAQEKALEKALQGNLTAQNAQLKIAKDELTVQNKIAQEAKAQLQYQQQITSLQNDMKTAMISGNYLQAASLKQQISGAAVDFNATSVQTKMQDQVDTLQNNADQINQALSDLKDAIANGATKIDASILAAKKIKPIDAKSIVSGVAGNGVTVEVNITSTGEVTHTSTTSSHPKTKTTVSHKNPKVVPSGSKINNVRGSVR